MTWRILIAGSLCSKLPLKTSNKRWDNVHPQRLRALSQMCDIDARLRMLWAVGLTCPCLILAFYKIAPHSHPAQRTSPKPLDDSLKEQNWKVGLSDPLLKGGGKKPRTHSAGSGWIYGWPVSSLDMKPDSGRLTANLGEDPP